MIDRALTLAIAVASDAGSYALLLGSGVSRPSGIPTGWEIVNDLSSRVAAAEGSDAGPDPAAWYRERFGTEPDYTELLSALSPRPAERSALLRSYFEPTEQEREQGLKTPTAAHRAIARLVSDRWIRVILTTNFDRLLESALSAEGVSPIVVANDASAESAPPPDRTRCTVVKLHGDFLDTRLRNTADELATYEPHLTQLVERILDDYGLVVVGWSATWDTQLRELVTVRAGRKYSLYWVRRGELSPEASSLVAETQGGVIATASADAFFERLDEQVRSVSSLAQGQPISDRVAVATVKRLLPQPTERIRLEDFLSDLQTTALEAVQGFETPPTREGDTAYVARLAQYESASMAVAGGSAVVAAWGDDDELLARAVRRLTRVPAVGGFTYWLALRKYLPSLVFYAACCAALHRARFSVLARLFRLTLEIEGEEKMAADALVASSVLLAEPVSAEELRLEGKDPKTSGRRKTPASDRYLRVLRPALRDIIPDDGEFESTFEMLELLLSMFLAAQTGAASPGRFAWRWRGGPVQQLRTQLERLGESWPGIGLYGSPEATESALAAATSQTHGLAFP